MIKKSWLGLPASPGVVQGEAFVLKPNIKSNTNKPHKNGYILVAKYITPDLVDFIFGASALVVDAGGLTCHAAVIARELGIPCVVNTHTVSAELSHGKLIEVDGNKGLIKLIKAN